MLKWQHLFSQQILRRGQEYFRKNKVRSLIKDGDVYYATVEGTEEYSVEIHTAHDTVTEMLCSCPYAEGNGHCRHMAAALFEISARDLPGTWRSARKSRSEIFPFADFEEPSHSRYRFYKAEQFARDLIVCQDTYDKALALLKDPSFSIQIREVYSQLQGEKSLQAWIDPERENGTKASVTVNRDTVERMACYTRGCRAAAFGYLSSTGKRKEPCEHVLAVLLKLAETLREEEIGDATDPAALRALSKYQKRMAAGKTESGEEERTGNPVEIEPRLEDSFQAFRLSFRIGTGGKLYVLRSIQDLVDAVEEKKEFPLGKATALRFSSDTISDESRPYYEMIRCAVLEQRHRERTAPARSGSDQQALELYGALLDEFYAITEDHHAVVRVNDSWEPLHLKDGGTPAVLTLRKEKDSDGTFHGVILSGRLPELIDGMRYRYYREGSALIRVKPEDYEKLVPLMEEARGGFLEMHIGRSYLTDFYYNILPEIASCADVLEPDREEIEAYLPPEAGFAFYLDAEDGIPVCRADVQYGEDLTFPLSDWVSLSGAIARVRDSIRESAVLRTVQEFFPLYREPEDDFSSEDDPDSIYRVLSEGVDALYRVGTVMSTARFDSLKLRRNLQIQVGVSVDSDLMELQILSEDVTLKELYEVLNSYKLKKKYHRLKNGDFVSLDESIAELAALVDMLRLSPQEFIRGRLQVPAYRALYLERMLEENRQIYAVRDRHYRSLVKAFNTVKDSDYEVPDSLQQVLRPYQVYGYKWLRTLAGCGFGGILADDMGLGKTVQMIAVLLAEKEEGTIGTSLIACPASLVYNWVEEFHRFAPELQVCPVEGTQAERQLIIERCYKWDVIISSYDHLKRDCACYEDRLFLYHVLDEAQFIKNHATAASKTVKIIRSKHRFALTGTPIENRLSELWSIFDFLMPGFLYGYETFRNELEKPITKNAEEEAAIRLRRMVAPFVLRRLKSEVLKDLPDKVEESRMVRFGEEQQRLYDAQIVRMKDMLKDETEETYRKSKIQILAELTRIRQICCDPALLFEDYAGGSAKLDACVDLLNSAVEGGHRVLLFSQFTSMLDLIKVRLKEEGLPWYEITGETPKKERLRLVDTFNTGDVPVFLISLRAGGTGLNLTGADIVIHYDPWWNAAAQNQATDRAHRIGQEKVVNVYKLIVKDSIEEKIQKLQEKKLALADEIIGGETVSFSSLSREELLELIG